MKFTNKLWIAILIAGFIIGGIADSFIESDKDGSAETPDASSSIKSNHPIAKNFQTLAGLCIISSGDGADSTDAARTNLGWLLAAHLGLVVSALLLALTEWLSLHKSSGAPRTKSENK